MAGIETLLPPMTSDPNARIWTQLRALQQRVAALEARRDVVIRSNGGMSPLGEENSFTFSFSTSGRPLLVHFGGNRIYLGPSATGEFPVNGNVFMDIASPTPHRLTTTAQNWSTVPLYQTTNVASVVLRDIEAGTWNVTVSANRDRMNASWLILELPA